MASQSKTKTLPRALPLRKILGPSFIILGLGLGSGEVILWPYLASQYGMGLIWGAVLGLTLQFFMNMEIERYTLARGESIFVGYTRKFRGLPWWFMASTFVPWMWPGIAAVSGALLAYVFGVAYAQYMAAGLLLLMGLVLSLGPGVYKTVETIQKVLVAFGVPSIFLISVLLAKQEHWAAAAKGLAGIGEGYWLIPVGVGVTFVAAKFLSALAYSGPGGNLNLVQSFYVREKGFGMGKFAHMGMLEGVKFPVTEQSVSRFKKWWRVVNIEHFIVFWLTGSITILLLSLLAYATVFGTTGQSDNLSFVLHEATAIGAALMPAAGIYFLMVISLILFGTQLSIYDATSRIIAENVALAVPGRKQNYGKKLYFIILWAFIAVGMAIMLLFNKQPIELLVIAAVMNAFAMFVHSGLTIWLNHTELPKAIAPGRVRTAVMIFACLFYGVFSIFVIVTELQKLLS